MLLLNMTHEEVYKEVYTDLRNAERYEEHLWNSFRRMSLKMKDFPKYIFTEYTSPRKNKWLITTKFWAKNDFSSTFGVLQIQNGLVLHQAFVNSANDKFSTLCTFIPHFFDRYAQYNRFDCKGRALIRMMLKNDCSFNIDKTQEISGIKEQVHENNVHICMKHGIGLGYEVGNKHFLIKTYITYEMSRGRQKMIFESKRDDMQRIKLDTKGFFKSPLEQPKLIIDESEIKKLKRKLGIL